MAAARRRANDLTDSLKNDETVRLYAEDCAEPYLVQRTLLTRASKWFRTALSENFSEGQKLELRFPGTNEETLKVFLNWLFEKRLPKCDKVLEPSYRQEEQLMAVHLWAFADEHLLPKLQNAAMAMFYWNAILEGVFPTIDTLQLAYENSAPGSKLQELMMSQVSRGLLKADRGHEAEEAFKGYSADDIGRLGEVPGFTTHLAKHFLNQLIGNTGGEWRDVSVKEYLVDDAVNPDM